MVRPSCVLPATSAPGNRIIWAPCYWSVSTFLHILGSRILPVLVNQWRCPSSAQIGYFSTVLTTNRLLCHPALKITSPRVFLLFYLHLLVIFCRHAGHPLHSVSAYNLNDSSVPRLHQDFVCVLMSCFSGIIHSGVRICSYALCSYVSEYLSSCGFFSELSVGPSRSVPPYMYISSI